MAKAVLYVGIDVSNAKLDVAFLDGDARQVRGPGTFANDPQGWPALKTAVVAAAALVGAKARVVCGMESTGNMHKRVEQELRAEKRRPVEVHVLNPRAVRHFAKALLKDSKTDRVDSHLIALFLLRMQPRLTAPMPEGFEELKEATRTRRTFLEERTEHKNRLHKLLRVHLPGYRKVLDAKQLPRRLLLVLVDLPSPHLLLARAVDDLAEIRYGGTHRVGQPFAEKLHTLAAQAPQAELPRVTQLLVATTARRILELNMLLAEMDAAIDEMLRSLFPAEVVSSIPGLGAVSTAAILAEVGDVQRFATKTEFVGYCGLYPIVWESGDSKLRFRMTYKGNRMLKMTLLVASAAARQYNPIVAGFYERLRRRGKSKKAAGGAIARKMAELVFTLLVRNEPWNPEKARRGIEKADAMAPAAA